MEARKREAELWDKSVDEWKHEMEMNTIPKKMWPKKQYQAARAGTLVICPGKHCSRGWILAGRLG